MTNTRVSTSGRNRLLSLVLALVIAVIALVPSQAFAITVRDKAPEGMNPWYYSDVNPYYRYEGLAPKPQPVDGVYVTGNCTWYAWGRAAEIAGEPLKLGAEDPNGMWQQANSGLYETGSEPRVGAICVGYSNGSGHVSVVEKIVDGVPYVSESGYREKRQWPGYDKVEFHYGEVDEWMGSIIGYIYVLDNDPYDRADYDSSDSDKDDASDTVQEAVWERIWGENAYDTMRAVIQADDVFESGRGGTVVVATGYGYWDALAASGLAGALDAPIVITPTDKLCEQAELELERLDPDKVLVMGGNLAVSDAVESKLKRSYDVTRIWGQAADDTAREIYEYGNTRNAWGNTAIVATSNGYWDALSIAPFSYFRKAPIFLTNGSTGKLSDATIKAIERGGFTRVVIVGGHLAVPSSVDDQLENVGVHEVLRLWGENALDTSAEIATWEVNEEGMGISHLAVATSNGYWDALTAAPVAGQTSSVLVLVGKDGGYQAFDEVYDSALVSHGHVLGGNLAISGRVWSYITNA